MRTFLALAIFALTIIFGCNQTPRNVKEIDFNNTAPLESSATDLDKGRKLRVAVSAILSPKETYNSYTDIFKYLSSRIGRDIEFHQRKTYQEVNQMLESGQLDFAFICSGAYIDLTPEKGVELLCVPITQGKPLYQAYVIVPANSSAKKFEDLKGSSFAFTDPLSNTGYLYVLYRLSQLNQTVDGFFSSTLFTNGHDISIQMVAKGLLDGATIDGLVYDYLSTKDPQRVNGIRIIEKSQYFGIPPIVISSHLDPELKSRIQDVFLNIHKDPQGKKLIKSLLIDRFEIGNDSNYNEIREMRKSVTSKETPKLKANGSK
jgi:phosphonate transport system substrate-binding protein